MADGDLPPHSLAGMTVNERLAARGLEAEWQAATTAQDRPAMLRLLQRVAVPDARRVVDLILADPAAYL